MFEHIKHWGDYQAITLQRLGFIQNIYVEPHLTESAVKTMYRFFVRKSLVSWSHGIFHGPAAFGIAENGSLFWSIGTSGLFKLF